MKEKGHIYDSYFQFLRPALISKAEEFEVLGYGTVTERDLWSYLTSKKWKKPKEGIRMYELVSDVLSMNASDYMNYVTIEAYRSPANLDSEELQQLLQLNEQN